MNNNLWIINYFFSLLFFMFVFGCAKPKISVFHSDRDLRQNISKIAVLPFNNLAGIENETEVIESTFAKELSARYSLNVIEGEELNRKLSERNFKIKEISNRALAFKIAKILDLDAVVYGDVLEYRYRKWITQKKGMAEDPCVGISARAINGETGTVIWSATVAKSTYGLFTIGSDAISSLAAEVIKEIVESAEFNEIK